MLFKVVMRIPINMDDNIVYLRYVDDTEYCAVYEAFVKNQTDAIKLGYVKIGCRSSSHKIKLYKSQNGFDSFSINKIIPTMFFKESPLSNDFFSLGESILYYKKVNIFFREIYREYYETMNDIAFDFAKFEELYEAREASLINYLLRNVHYSDVEQFHRISIGDAELTLYTFGFYYNNDFEKNIEFVVDPNSIPPSNIHVLIGRNGVGKTWLLYQMAICFLKSMEVSVDDSSSAKFKTIKNFMLNNNLKVKFAGVVGVSFSVFDDGLSSIKLSTFDYNVDEQEKKRLQEKFQHMYKYIGIIKNFDNTPKKGISINTVSIKTVDDFADEFHTILKTMLNKRASDDYKISLYLEVCDNLETDAMLRDTGFITVLKNYLENPSKNTINNVIDAFKKLSSGHMVIVLSLITLCESIHEKTIVLIDEPETHLHPPLLSTYIRTLSVLLRKRNAVGIIATHSPIVLQEVPSGCVTKVERVGEAMTFYRPQTESFAASTDQLTRDVFGYEIMKTGFYKLIEDNLQNDFDLTYEKFNSHVGFLGQIMIQGLLNRNGGDKNEED